MPSIPAAAPEAASREHLILRLNEIYHDLENRAYDEKHPDILEDGIPRWRRILAAVLPEARPAWRVLDVGSGTGFVPLLLAARLRPDDELACSDISAAMLEVCRAKVEKAGHLCRLSLLKLDGRTLPLPDRSQDLVTVNAVLHHLPRPERLAAEIDRILKPGGQVLVGHEPTRTHAESRLMACNYWLLVPMANIKLFGYELCLRLGWFEPLRRPLSRYLPELEEYNRLLQDVNGRLLAEGLIREPLPAAAMSCLLDAQSPNAGGPQRGRGFSREVIAGLFPGYRLEHAETYTHLGKVPLRKPWIRRYADWLARRYPDLGANISCVLRKPAS